MENTRRRFIKLGATVAAGAAFASNAFAAQSAREANPVPAEISPIKGLRLVTFSPDGTTPSRVGAVLPDGQVVDLKTEAQQRNLALSFDPSAMVSLISAGEKGLTEVSDLVLKAAKADARVQDVRLFSPIPVPRSNIYCVGWNYLAHFEEGKNARADKGVSKLPEHPVFFTKAPHAMNGPFDSIPYDPAVSTLIDWEGEMAVIIGKKGRNIPEKDAMNYVFGFSVINDTTARDVQQKRHGGQWFKGKSLDGHGPMGPWIVAASDIDYDNLRLVTRVNGTVKQDASTAQMYFKVPRIIAELSLGLTLEPGDVIATGTPPGVGFARKPPEFLKPGDIMETEISGIGLIRNRILAA